MNVLISIITVNLNDKNGLLKTIDSIKSQTFKSFEYIVIDGASTDGSIEVINNNSSSIHKWISEKDSGIYDAMNKGVSLASGEYCLFLNAGDALLKENSLEIVANAANTTRDIISFSVLYDYGNRLYLHSPPTNISFGHFFIGGLHHQGTLIRRRLFSELGPYDTSFRVAADWAFFLTAIFKHNASVETHQIPVTLFDTKGLTSSAKGKQKNETERELFLKREFPLLYDDYKILNDDLFKYMMRFPTLHRILRGVLIAFLFPMRGLKRILEMVRSK